MADVQIDAAGAEALHLVIDGACDHVARSQFAAFVETLHEAAAIGEQQPPAFAAHGFRNQERPRLRMVEAGGVELVELHVGDAAAGPPRHGDAVARGAVGVGGVQVDLAGAARGQHDGLRLHHFHGVFFAVVDVGAVYAVGVRLGSGAELLRRDHVHRHPPALDGDVRMRRRLFDQRPGDGRAGRVRHVQHPPMRMPALPGQMRSIALSVEGEAKPGDVLDALRPPRDDVAHDVFVAQAPTGRNGVRHMSVERVRRMRHRRYPALGAIGGPAMQRVLGEHGHPQAIGQMQRRSPTPRHRCRSPARLFDVDSPTRLLGFPCPNATPAHPRRVRRRLAPSRRRGPAVRRTLRGPRTSA